MTALVAAFRFIVFAIMVIGLMAHMGAARTQGVALFAPLVRAIIIVTALAYLDVWFPKVDQTFLTVADYINPGYNNNPTGVSDTVRESTTANPEGKSWSWRQINQSIYQAITNALAAVFIFIGTLLTVPMLIVQYVLKWLLYLLAPFALAMFMVPGFSSIGVRFFQQVLAVHAWPVGFSITNLVALAIWNDFRDAVGANPATVTDALYSPLLTNMGGLLAVIVIIVGMISTPIVMQKLFVQGLAFTGTSGNPASVFRATSTLIRGTTQGGNGAGAGTPAAAALARNSPPPAPMASNMRPGI
ncbi:MAG: hypothetical protein ABI273_14780 [Lacunisphaera sp.]